MLINILGFLASVISFALWIPQAKITWENRNIPEKLAGISKGTQMLVIANATIWALYSILTEAYWTGAPGIVNLPLAVATLVLIRRAERKMNPVGEFDEGTLVTTVV